MNGIVFSAVLLSVSLCSGQDIWALLVAGSSGYDNYRHQADVCHSYHVLIEHGIPREKIVVMMYDDIAYNEENPVQGSIINSPGGPNVYEGVDIDYSGDNMTPEVLLKVLKGDEDGIEETLGIRKRVIKSGSEDRIFMFYSDHGGPGMLTLVNDTLFATDLHETIKYMYKYRQYKEMVLYIEACYAGSMFADLLGPDLNVYATTAANAEESSFACYWVEELSAFVGDVYSVSWMEDSDMSDLTNETLDEQFDLVKNETTRSHVLKYGTANLGWLPLSNFQGNQPRNMFTNGQIPSEKQPITDAVPSEDVPISTLMRKVTNFQDEEASERLNTLIKKNEDTETFFRAVVTFTSITLSYEELMSTPVHFSNFTCYRESVQILIDVCPGMDLTKNGYALKNLKVLANLCEIDIPHEKIWTAIWTITYESVIC